MVDNYCRNEGFLPDCICDSQYVGCIKDSCGATCDSNDDCACSGNQTYVGAYCDTGEGNYYVGCDCQNQTNLQCVKDSCGAGCDSDDDCSEGYECNLSCSCESSVPKELTVCSSGCNYTTIHDAVGNASSGDTIIVYEGIYDEQVVIGKNLTVEGAGDNTIIRPSSASVLSQVFTGLFWYGGTKNVAGIIVANVPSGINVTIRNLKVDESNVTTKPVGSDYLAGIFYRETGGTIDNVTITGGGAWSGTDRGYGIFLSSASNDVVVEIKDSEIDNYDKNGIEVMGNQLTANIYNNIITGRGSVSDEVQNGVNVGRDAVGIVNYNTISNLAYQPASSLSAGILFYHYVTPTGKTAITTGNVVTNCQIGIIFKNANSSAQNNIVSGGTVGLDGIFSQPNYAGVYTASFVNNTVSNMTNRSAIDAETYSTLTPPNGATLIASIINNTLTTGYGTADGIYIGGGAGGVVATISGNTISGFGEYGINLGDARVSGANVTSNAITNNLRGVSIGASVNASNIFVNLNNIAENQDYNAYNGGSGILDAETNWWGSAPPDTGKFSGNITYYPFCMNAECSLTMDDELSGFVGNTTDFSAIADWENVTLVLETGGGIIEWDDGVNLTGSSLRFSDMVSIASRRISVDSASMPELAGSVVITFYNSGFNAMNKFLVYRNGIICPDSVCYFKQVSGSRVIVGVTALSVYELSGSGIGEVLGESGEGLGYFLNAITNPVVNIILGLGLVAGILMVFFGIGSAVRKAVVAPRV